MQNQTRVTVGTTGYSYRVREYKAFGLSYWLFGVFGTTGRLIETGSFMSETYARRAAERIVNKLSRG